MGPIVIIVAALVFWIAAGALTVCLCVLARRGDAQESASLAARERAVWGGRRTRNEPVAVERRSRAAA